MIQHGDDEPIQYEYIPSGDTLWVDRFCRHAENHTPPNTRVYLEKGWVE